MVVACVACDGCWMLSVDVLQTMTTQKEKISAKLEQKTKTKT